MMALPTEVAVESQPFSCGSGRRRSWRRDRNVACRLCSGTGKRSVAVTCAYGKKRLLRLKANDAMETAVQNLQPLCEPSFFQDQGDGG